MSKRVFNELKSDLLSLNLPSINLSEDGVVKKELYMKEKNGYSFHIFHTREGEGRSLITELYYNLKDKKYWVKRNGKNVNFTTRNIDPIFPVKEYIDRWDIEKRRNLYNEFFSFISTDQNEGLYKFAYDYLGKMGKERVKMLGRFFYRLIKEYSYVETLYKAGVRKDLMGYRSAYIIHPNETSPAKILGLDKTEWKAYSQYKSNGLDLRSLQSASKNATFKEDELCSRDMLNYLRLVEKLDDKYGLNKTLDFIDEELSVIYNQYGYRSIISLADQYGLNKKRAIEYAYYEVHVSQGIKSPRTVHMYWYDYLRMSREMGLEKIDKYPRFLKTMHDVVSMNYDINLSEEQKEQFKVAYEVNKEYYYEDRLHVIFAPETPEDLIKEGNQMGHCVGSYVSNVCKQTSTILFLRKKEDVDKSYITIEVRDNHIVQAKCKMNFTPDEDQKKIINDFAVANDLKVKGY